MRQKVNLIAVVVLMALMAVSTASGSDRSDLQGFISSYNDPKMSTYDLAFVLATHGYDATPRGDHVDVELGGVVYRLVPGNDVSGFARIISQVSGPE